jgi:cytochrome bd ubiquinol oxidase subunit II
MPDVSVALAAALVASLTLYVVFGGADFGGGVWALLAFGPRAERQRDTIARALAPVWEANHVWLVLAIVMLFTGFPSAFAAVATALHVPITLLLFGIVLRGAAFVFRAYGGTSRRPNRSWGHLFALASAGTPLLIGMIVGALTEGHVHVARGRVQADLFSSWTTPFCVLVGVFAVSLFAFLAAVYLTVEADSPGLADDFRRRALWSGSAVAAMAVAVFVAAPAGVRAGLSTSFWAPLLHVATGTCAVLAFACLYARAFRWARIAAAAQASCIVWGWALVQYPFLIRPDVTALSAAAPAATTRLLLVFLGTGGLVLFPALAYLFSVFDPASRHHEA